VRTRVSSHSGTTVNAPDAIALARFYAEITGGVAKGYEHWALVDRILP